VFPKALASYSYEKNEEAKKQKYDETMKKAAFLLEKLDAFLAKNGGHFLKGQVEDKSKNHIFKIILNHLYSFLGPTSGLPVSAATSATWLARICTLISPI